MTNGYDKNPKLTQRLFRVCKSGVFEHSQMSKSEK